MAMTWYVGVMYGAFINDNASTQDEFPAFADKNAFLGMDDLPALQIKIEIVVLRIGGK